MAVTSIRNETPSRLTLTGTEGKTLTLAPLQEIEIGEGSGFHFDELEREGVITTHREAPSKLRENIATTIFAGGFWLVVFANILSGVDPWFGPAEYWPMIVWGIGASALGVTVLTFIIRGTNSFTLIVRVTMQAVALTVILAIGFVLPALTIYFFGGGEMMLADFGEGPENRLALFGRLLQLAIITVAALLPVLLFFLFDRYKLITLRNRLYANLFRLDRSVTTTNEINAKYGSQIHETYGPDDQGQGRLSPGTRWPVLFCAVVITVGWVVALAPVGLDFNPANAREVVEGLLPQQSPIVFGFLGVYFFSLRMIGIRYARGDLKPKVYSHITVRVFIVIVLSWVLDAIAADIAPNLTLFLAFLFGITPDEFFTWSKELFRGKVPTSAFPQQSLPLNELEGIDLYDLSRLESEGIVNIEGLAHHELIDLIIETRIPVPRLIDWVDQAILYLHLSGGTDAKARTMLRDFGIRTATDLLRAWSESEGRGENEHLAFKQILGDTKTPYRLEVIRDALLDDEWMDAVSCWRSDEKHPPIEREALPKSRNALIEQAGIELAASRYPMALELYSAALRAQDTADVRRSIAMILATTPVIELRDPDTAKMHARLAFELGEHDYSGLVELIEIYLALEEPTLAKETLKSTLKLVATLSKRAQRDVSGQLDALDKRIKALSANGDDGVQQASDD